MKQYDPETYWTSRLGDSTGLAQVGQQELGAYNRIAYRLRRRAVTTALRQAKETGPFSSVFEAGFGVGFYLQLWGQLGIHRVSGIDISLAAVERARTLFPEYELEQQDVATLPDLGKTFDVVTAIDVLYHIVDDGHWRKSLQNLCGLVGPTGHLIFTDKFPATTDAYQIYPHVRRRPIEWYAQAMSECGLSITRIRPVFVFMDDGLPTGRPKALAKLSYQQWRAIAKLIRLFGRWPSARDAVAALVATLEYPIELAALQMLGRSPNLEIVIANRRSR
jgi:ubiquinone/menaquinone biosynthesis C-methylase UbiE